MKLVMVSGDPLQETFGGVEEHTDQILHALSSIDELNIHVITYGENNGGFEQENIAVHRFKRHSIHMIFYPFAILHDVFRILRKIREIDPDIVHFQGTHPLYGLAAVLCQRKRPTVLTVHGILAREFDFHPDAHPLVKFISVYAEKFALYFLKNVVVVAPQIGEIVENMTKGNVFVIPNGIDLPFIQTIDPLPLKRDNIVLFVGNLVKLKGVADLIRAISFVKREIPDVCLLIAGSGPQKSELKDHVNSLFLQDNVKFLGFVKGKEKFSYFKCANILAVPSLWESLPIVVLEGMACGRPIVASQVGGIPYLIHNAENGYLVHPGAVDELAEKICVLLRDKSLQKQMGKKSLKRVEELTWDRIADMSFELYNQILVDGESR